MKTTIKSLSVMALSLSLLLSISSPVTTFAQGSYGTGKLPNTPPKIKRELKTVVIIESVDAEELTFKGTDEITGDKLKYRASKRTSVSAEKSLFNVFGKKELSFNDLKSGQRIEIKYNQNLPTAVTEIKVLKEKN